MFLNLGRVSVRVNKIFVEIFLRVSMFEIEQCQVEVVLIFFNNFFHLFRFNDYMRNIQNGFLNGIGNRNVVYHIVILL